MIDKSKTQYDDLQMGSNQLRFGNLPSAELKSLANLSPLRVVFDTLACWFCIGSCWALVVYINKPWVFLLAIPLIAVKAYALVVIAHDGIHRSLFKNTSLNDWFTDLFILGAFGAITRINNLNHLTHHAQLTKGGDPDRFKYATSDKCNITQLFVFLFGLSTIARTLKNALLSTGQNYGRLYRPRDLLIITIWQFLLISVLTISIGWWGYPLLWAFPAFVLATILNNARSFCEHSSPEPDPEADLHRLVNFRSNYIERIFFSPFNVNWHGLHHTWPNIPYYHLERANAILESNRIDSGILYRSSYLKYLCDYIRFLRISNTELDLHGARP